MKLASALALLLATLSASAPSPSFLDSQSPIKAELLGPPVKGDNPLTYCADPSNYTLQIQNVDLTPNPPLPGKSLLIKATGTLNEPIEKGAYVLLTVKYGLITILNQHVDLCDQLKEVDLSCPLKKGQMTLTKKVDLPQQIPPGKYSVRADAYDKDNDHITCLAADNIEFKIGS